MAVPDNLFKKFGGLKDYRSYLTNQLGQHGEDAESRARTQAYEGVGRSTQSALQRSRDDEIRATGGQQTTGMGAMQRASLVQRAPYGTANIGATQAGQQQMIAMGRALTELGLSKGNYYQMIQGVQMQQEALKNNAAAMAAGSSGGGLF